MIRSKNSQNKNRDLSGRESNNSEKVICTGVEVNQFLYPRFLRAKSANAYFQGKAENMQSFKKLIRPLHVFFKMHSDEQHILWTYFGEIFN